MDAANRFRALAVRGRNRCAEAVGRPSRRRGRRESHWCDETRHHRRPNCVRLGQGAAVRREEHRENAPGRRAVAAQWRQVRDGNYGERTGASDSTWRPDAGAELGSVEEHGPDQTRRWRTASMLELKGISKAFGPIGVARDIELTLSRGEPLGVIRPNGAGKATLFNLVTGMLRPDRGRIILEGKDIPRMPPEARCRFGLGRSFPVPLPFTHLTVFENLSVAALFGAQVSEVAAVQLCGEILSLTGLETKANVLAGSLPLLDRKRLELARALATRPRILLLDEIAGGLTDAECHLLVETIRDIRKGGVAIIWIEHVVHALLAVVDRLIALDFGRIAMQGAPTDVMRSKEVQAIYMGVPA